MKENIKDHVVNIWFLSRKIQKLTKLHCIVQGSIDVHLGGKL